MLATLAWATFMQTQSDLPQINMANLKTMTFMIFTSADTSPQGISDEALKQQQADHIANLTRLYQEKKSPVAGPFANEKEWRGIVILDLPTDKVKQEFTEDPFVKNNRLNVNPYAWTVDKTIFAWPTEDLGMAQYTLVLARAGDPANRDESGSLMPQHLGTIARLYTNGKLAAAGPITGLENVRGLYLFHGTDRKDIESELAKDKMFTQKHLVADFKTLYLGKGLFKKPKL